MLFQVLLVLSASHTKMYFPIMLSSVCEFNFEVKTRTATKFLSLLLSCVAPGSDTQGTHKEQNLFFVRYARG